MGTERRRLFCIRCEPSDYEAIQINLAALSERTGLPRGRTLARLLKGTAKARRKPSETRNETSEANRARTEAARAAKAAKATAKRAAKAESTPDQRGAQMLSWKRAKERKERLFPLQRKALELLRKYREAATDLCDTSRASSAAAPDVYVMREVIIMGIEICGEKAFMDLAAGYRRRLDLVAERNARPAPAAEPTTPDAT